ncbi:MAG: plasmid pRiA4b ORF-3 family protein [Coprothermobacterota bacterium]|nr:plasmid pRiA4b ORF-3 family protein [Coprothermobacterota bacterium]
MPTELVDSEIQIVQLKIALRESKPSIWRRVMAPGQFSLYKLHKVIQAAMGWTDSHLHQFNINGLTYSIPSSEDWQPVIDERRHKVIQIAALEKRKFIYEYDFGDSWMHNITVEKITPPETGVKYPVCIGGKRACPPEDVGGIWGYSEFLAAIRNPKHEEHDSYLEWIGGEFDPEKFNLEQTNRALQRVR